MHILHNKVGCQPWVVAGDSLAAATQRFWRQIQTLTSCRPMSQREGKGSVSCAGQTETSRGCCNRSEPRRSGASLGNRWKAERRPLTDDDLLFPSWNMTSFSVIFAVLRGSEWDHPSCWSYLGENPHFPSVCDVNVLRHANTEQQVTKMRLFCFQSCHSWWLMTVIKLQHFFWWVDHRPTVKRNLRAYEHQFWDGLSVKCEIIQPFSCIS